MQNNSNHYRDNLNNVMMQSFKSFEDAKLQKKQFKHDWMIAICSSLTGIITGAIAGVIASIIYNAIAK